MQRSDGLTPAGEPEPKPETDPLDAFTDLDKTQWYVPGIRYVFEHGIMSGVDGGELALNDEFTREQLVTILYRYAKNKGVDVSVGADTNILGYDDALDVSDWASDAMRWAVGSGLVSGKTATTLNPADSATRAEIATIIMRYCENITK